MTSELRPAEEVASAVYDECREKGIRDGGALIKADREAVRAEQDAELAKFKALAETLAGALDKLHEAYTRKPAMQVELKPCPFCGGDNASQFFHADTGYGESWHVECLSEDCGAGTGFYDTEAEAIAAWNTRAGDSQ